MPAGSSLAGTNASCGTRAHTSPGRDPRPPRASLPGAAQRGTPGRRARAPPPRTGRDLCRPSRPAARWGARGDVAPGLRLGRLAAEELRRDVARGAQAVAFGMDELGLETEAGGGPPVLNVVAARAPRARRVRHERDDKLGEERSPLERRRLVGDAHLERSE